MSKNRLALHSVAILAIVFFTFLAISSTASTPKIAAPVGSTETVVSSKTTSRGRVNDLPGPDQRPFDALGLVFATTETKYDQNGNEIANQEGIVNLLLREAQKLGGNDILNLRTDENVTFYQSKIKEGSTEKTITTKTVIITGSALAIKYLNNASTATASGNSSGNGVLGNNLVPNKFTIEGTVK
ncbi:hypothetical protein [Treponema sp. R80B11-R83G3]